MSKLAPTTHAPSTDGSTMPPRSTTARGGSNASAGTSVSCPRTRLRRRCGTGWSFGASKELASTTTWSRGNFSTSTLNLLEMREPQAAS